MIDVLTVYLLMYSKMHEICQNMAKSNHMLSNIYFLKNDYTDCLKSQILVLATCVLLNLIFQSLREMPRYFAK